MIKEYAPHNGDADLLRECIDGVTGEQPRRAGAPCCPAARHPSSRPG